MKLTVTVLLLIAASQAAEVKSSRSHQKTDDAKTDKREVAEGNAAVEKRAPVLPTAPPSVTPGIEYADSKEAQPEKSPAQIYATPVPQIAKISDLLTAQGPPFQAAIASHLLSPVSVYQPRLATPTTYEVSSPIASQLAYSEHKIAYQPPQNAIQYQPVHYNQKLQAPKQANFVRPINFQHPYQQQIFAQPQHVVYSQPPQLVPIPQPLQYQQIQQIPYVPTPVQYTQQNVFPQHFVQRPIYQQPQRLIQVAQSAQPGVTYAREESNEEQNREDTSQKQLKSAEESEGQSQASEIQTPSPEKNSNSQPQGAVSYASFSQSQPAPSFAQRLHYQPQPQRYQGQPQQFQVQPQQFQAQPQQFQAQPQQFQAQPQQYQAQPQQYQAQSQQYQAQPQGHQIQLQQYNAQPQPLFQNQPQPQQPAQYEIQIQYQTPQNLPSKPSQETIATASTKTLPVNPQRPIAYFRPGPVLPQIQPLHQQNYPQGQQILIQSPHPAPQPLSVTPSFPPVQYFGKFAQSIFGGVQH